MFILYDLIFLFVLVFYFVPHFLIRRKRLDSNFIQRLGFLSKNLICKLKNKPNIWIHAVSVGEAVVASSLAERIKQDNNFKDKFQLVVSTTTSTGQRIAKDNLDKDDIVIYFPFDLSFIVKKVIKAINPYLFILVETELWPNIITQIHKQNVPVVVANGRISDESYLGYKLISIFFRNVFRYIDLFCMQSKSDYKRIISLGAREDRVKVCGNIKFDMISDKINEDKIIRLKDWLGYEPSNNILLCGSTHPGEEEILINVYKRLLSRGHNLKLVIVPRHPERSVRLKELFKSYGFNSSLFLNPTANKIKDTIYVLDEIGWLRDLYSICSVAFIGGSLKDYGGHNIIEPALFQKPVIFGRYMSNFRSIASEFLDNKAAIQIEDKENLYKTCSKLLDDKNLGLELAKRSLRVVRNNQGATDEILKSIIDLSKK